MSPFLRAGAIGSVQARKRLSASENIDPPVLTWYAPEVGSSPTITPGTWTGSPTLTYTLLRDGVPVGGATELSHAAAEAYTAVAADIGPGLAWRETASGGPYADTNGAQFEDLSTLSEPPSAYWNGYAVSTSGGEVTQADDISGNSYHVTFSVGLRPATGRTINGIQAIDFQAADRGQSAGTIGDVFTSSTAFILAVGHLDDARGTFTTGSGTSNYYASAGWVGSVGGYIGLGAGVVSGTDKAYFGVYDGGGYVVTDNVSDGLNLLQGRRSGSTIGLRVNGNAEVTGSASGGGFGSTTVNLLLGEGNTAGSTQADVALGHVLCWPAAPSANVVATARAYLAYLYGGSW